MNNPAVRPSLLRPATSLLVVMSVLLGLAYPLVITAFARIAFPGAAAGSVVTRDGVAAGSRLIGQSFTGAQYFWGRPSATTPQAYNALGSTGSNAGPLNPALRASVRERAQALVAADPGNPLPIPVDLVTASASGLDPEISPAGAFYQVRRVARVRGLAPARVQALVEAHIEPRLLGLIGEPRVNVLELNLALDAGR